MLKRFHYVSDLSTGMTYSLIVPRDNYLNRDTFHACKKGYLKNMNVFEVGGTIGQL